MIRTAACIETAANVCSVHGEHGTSHHMVNDAAIRVVTVIYKMSAAAAAGMAKLASSASDKADDYIGFIILLKKQHARMKLVPDGFFMFIFGSIQIEKRMNDDSKFMKVSVPEPLCYWLPLIVDFDQPLSRYSKVWRLKMLLSSGLRRLRICYIGTRYWKLIGQH